MNLDELRTEASQDDAARMVLADHEEQHASTLPLLHVPDTGGKQYVYREGEAGSPKPVDVASLLRSPFARSYAASFTRPDVARIWRDELPALGVKRRKRIDKMTKAESAQMAAWAKKWTAIGLSTERADRALAEAAIHACYRLSGHPQPKAVVWVPCPLVLAYAGPIAMHLLRRDSIHDSVRDSVRASVRDSVRASVNDSVNASVRDSVHDSVRDSVHDSVGASVRDSVRASVSDSVRDSVSASVGCTEYWRHYLGGQFWVGGWGWGSAYPTFMLDVLGLDIGREQELKCRAYAALNSSACWSFWSRDFVLVSERPTLIKKHGDGQLEVARWEWTDADGVTHSWEVRP
jgi:hypothetical protein